MKVVVLNADYSILNTISWKRALVLLDKGRVEVVKYSNDFIVTVKEKIKVPSVVKLVKFIRMVYKKAVPLTKMNVFVRDNFTCAYCGKELQRNELTIDHIIPRAQNGKNTWENWVTSCKPCNCIKGDKTPNQAKMPLKKKVYQPTIGQFIQKKMELCGVTKILEDLWEC